MKELKCARRDEKMPVQNLDPFCSDHPLSLLITRHFPQAFVPRIPTPSFYLLTSGLRKKYFLQNEPNFSQCLPHFLKKWKAN
jgi:hypothetical protein